MTVRLEGGCSIQLSYGCMVVLPFYYIPKGRALQSIDDYKGNRISRSG
jgi:hypothetical protein